MHDIDKIKRKMSEIDRLRVDEVVSRINNGDLKGLDLKKLRGKKGTFRVRVGKYRISFVKTEEYGFVVVDIERRSDNSYT